MPGFHMRAVINKLELPLVADGEAGCIATIPAHFAEHELNHLLAGISWLALPRTFCIPSSALARRLALQPSDVPSCR
jgi:hypothetical protein